MSGRSSRPMSNPEVHPIRFMGSQFASFLWMATGYVLVALLVGGCGRTGPAPEKISVSLARSTSGDWSVSYALRAKTNRLVFSRNPDASRKHRWVPSDSAFEIVRIAGEDMVVRKDGGIFDRAGFQLTPAYEHLGQDYAPFSPFSDEGTLVHTGQFFVCPEVCSAIAPSWSFELLDQQQHRILVRGELNQSQAFWTDSEDGTMVYVGKHAPVETPSAWLVIDPAFPDQIVELLQANLPTVASYYSDRFGALPVKPTFFASYDANDTKSSSSQGGVLPDQIFMHFSGDSLSSRMAEPNFDLWLSWFFAHETAHLHQTNTKLASESWLHEGGAEALAAIIVHNFSDRGQEYVVDRYDEAAAQCSAGLSSIELESVASDGDFQMYYWCGLVLHLAVDELARRTDVESEGLFSIWSEYEAAIAGGAEPSGTTFRDILSTSVGSDVAEWARKFTTTVQPEFQPPNW